MEQVFDDASSSLERPTDQPTKMVMYLKDCNLNYQLPAGNYDEIENFVEQEKITNYGDCEVSYEKGNDDVLNLTNFNDHERKTNENRVFANYANEARSNNVRYYTARNHQISENFCEDNVEFPYANIKKMLLNETRIKEGLEYLNILHDEDIAMVDTVTDAKDFKTSKVPSFLQRNRKETMNVTSNDDADVIFVKEYLPIAEEALNLTLPKSSAKNISAVVRRRNPKRQVQVAKALLDLAKKSSIPPGIFNARIPRKKPENNEKNLFNCRRSCRTTGAVYNPPFPLSNSDYKTWPHDKMHETPEYNSVTKTIHQFNYVVRGIENSFKQETKDNKTTVTNSKVDEKSVDIFTKKTCIIDDAVKFIAHENLHLILNYVHQKKSSEQIRTSKDKICESNDFLKSLNLASKNENIEKRDETASLLIDACIFYCLTNNVDETALTQYLLSLRSCDFVK